MNNVFAIGQEIKDTITYDSSLNASLNNRIYPIAAPANVPLPFLLYRRVSLSGSYNNDCQNEYILGETFFIFSKSYAELTTLEDELNDCIYNNLTFASRAKLTDSQEDYDDQTDVYYSTLQYNFIIH